MWTSIPTIDLAAVDDPLATQTTWQTQQLVISPGAVIVLRRHDDADSMADPLATITAGGNHHGFMRLPFVLNARGNDGYSRGAGVDEPMPSITTSPPFSVVSPSTPFLLGYANGEGPAHGADEPLLTIHAGGKGHALIVPAAWVTTYNGNGGNEAVDHPLATVTAVARHALVEPGDELRLEDCFFRMLKVPEILVGMNFWPNYIVLGNQRQQVRQAGNAVTPCSAEWLAERVSEVLQ